jgi:hypothetical protein
MNSFFAAIDPVALILPERAYLIYVEMKHPHEPLVETFAKVAKEMTPAEKKEVLANVRGFTELANAVSAAVQHAEKSAH